MDKPFHCQYCNESFISKSNLSQHQRTAKYCLAKQGISHSNRYKCEYCDKLFTTKASLDLHYSRCETKDDFIHTKEIDNYIKMIDERDKKIEKLENQVYDLLQAIVSKDKNIQIPKNVSQKMDEVISV